MRKKIEILVILALLMVEVVVLMISGCGGKRFIPVVGKVSNTFGSNLGRDIDMDGDNDSAVVLSNIAGSNSNIGPSMAIDGNGKIYVMGRGSNGSNTDVYVIRLNSDGSIDSDFGNSLGRDIDKDGNTDAGVILNNIASGNSDDNGYSIAIDKSGKVYVTGYSIGYNLLDVYVIRLNVDGSIDSGFGENLGRDINGDGSIDTGVLLDNITGGIAGEVGSSIALDKNGKVYVTGFGWNGSNFDVYVIRLNEDGSIDSSFGRNGKVILNNIAGGNSVDFGYSIVIDGNGKAYVIGTSLNGFNFDVYVTRLNVDGSIDIGFGYPLRRDMDGDGLNDTGVVLDNIARVNTNDVSYSIAIDKNGKVYVTGSSSNGSNDDVFVIKIE